MSIQVFSREASETFSVFRSKEITKKLQINNRSKDTYPKESEQLELN